MLRSTLTILFLVLSSSTFADENHKSWLEYFVGEWTYEWSAEEGEFTETGKANYELEAGGSALEVEFVTANGDHELEIIGWQANLQRFLVAGFSSNGGYWHIEYDKVQKETLAGPGYGVLPDGRPWKCVFKLTRKSDSEFQLNASGEAGGEKLVTVGKFRRKGQAIPQAAKEAISRFVGNWRSDITVNGEKIGVDTGSRRWVEGEYALTISASASDGPTASGLTGWDPAGQQIIEHWFTSDGLHVNIRYPLKGVEGDNWKGNFSVSYPGGRHYDGKCTISFIADGWNFAAKWDEDGTTMVREGKSRRVK